MFVQWPNGKKKGGQRYEDVSKWELESKHWYVVKKKKKEKEKK